MGEFVFQPTYEWMKAKWLELANCPYCSSLLGQDIALRYYTCSYCGCGELALIHDQFLFARGPHLAEVPGRISEVLAFSTHPGALTMYLLAPMKEELLYRGILLRRLSSGLGLWPGLLVSSVVFGLLHPDPLQGAIVGLWLGWMYSPRFGGNLLLPIMAHCAFNLTAIPTGPVPVDFGF